MGLGALGLNLGYGLLLAKTSSWLREQCNGRGSSLIQTCANSSMFECGCPLPLPEPDTHHCGCIPGLWDVFMNDFRGSVVLGEHGHQARGFENITIPSFVDLSFPFYRMATAGPD